MDVSGYEKVNEVPYDFIRKRLSILIKKDNRHFLVTKGALANVLAVCPFAEVKAGDKIDTASVEQMIQQKFENLSHKGFRVLGVAMRDMGAQSVINKDSERDMTFLGFLLFFDPPKKGVLQTIERLKQMGVSLKVITGDNRLVAARISQDVGMSDARILTGPELHDISDAALLQQVIQTTIFAEVEPNQKERIISALRKAGHVVGYMGDGINDVSAFHASDVSISVDSAVDVAKESADIVLLEKNLEVLVQGVHQGRMTLANTMKYVFMATSANFGNMFSMAGASLFLSFLPLLPKQILLTNLMTDFPEMTIAADRTDPEMVSQPKRWNISFIKKFMLTFGLISSLFDYLTFGILLFILHSSQDQFRTGWFMESVISASIIVLVIRSRRPFFKSRPGKYLLVATMAVVMLALIFPFTPFAQIFGFAPLPISFLMILGMIIVLYILTAELAKRIFYQKIDTR